MKLSLLLALLDARHPQLGAQPSPIGVPPPRKSLRLFYPRGPPCEKERIETEMRTASGIINSHGKFIAGVVLITAGYSADGKYSHYLIVQAPITIADIALPPGSYVFGWQRTDDGLLSSSTSSDRSRTRHRNSPSNVPGKPRRIVSPLASWRSIHSADRTI